MRKSGFAEWLLRCAADEDRGTAIYGDLTEMAVTRGDVWFWFEYARTLVALTWRTIAGFVLGFAVFAVVSGFQFGNDWQRFVYFHFPHRWRRIPYGREGSLIYNFLYRVLSGANTTVCLLTSYAAMKYGVRDKMVRAAFAVGLMLTSAMALTRAWPVALSLVAASVVTTACALLVSEWRGAFATVAASLAVGTAITYCLLWSERAVLIHFSGYRLPLFRHRLLGFFLDFWPIVVLDMALLAVITGRLHQRFVSGKRIAGT